MPLYEYDCRACGERFELLRKISRRNHNTACPACKSRRTERRVTAPSVHFRGSGTHDSDSAPRDPRPKPLPKVTDGGQG